MGSRVVVAFILQVVLTIFVSLIGVSIVVQAAINVQLSEVVGNGIRAAWISFTVSALSVVPLSIHGPSTSQVKKSYYEKQLPWYTYTGGLLGASYIVASILLPPLIGLSLLFIAIVTGQLLISLALDHFGILGFLKRPISLAKAVGALCCLAGVVLVADLERDFDLPQLAYSVLGVITGTFLPLQAAFNKKVAEVVMTPYRATLFSCIIGSSGLLISSGIYTIFDPLTIEDPQVWKFTGGFIGVIYVCVAIVVPPKMGFTAFFVAINCGNIIGSLILDHVGFLGQDTIQLTFLRGLGGALALLGVLLVRYQGKGKKVEKTETTDKQKLLDVTAEEGSDVYWS